MRGKGGRGKGGGIRTEYGDTRYRRIDVCHEDEDDGAFRKSAVAGKREKNRVMILQSGGGKIHGGLVGRESG